MSGKVLEQQIFLDGIYIRPVWEFADIDVWVELQGMVCVSDGDCDGCDFGGGGGGVGIVVGVVVCRDWVDDVVADCLLLLVFDGGCRWCRRCCC